MSDNVSSTQQYRADAWADNWFAMYIGDQLVIEDSVSITTERSFNAESFSFDAEPGATLSFILKDFKETDSGLEYIGQSNQQMGDGGFIAQIIDQSSNETVLVTNSDWKCLTIHEAPLNKDCASSSNPDADCRFMAIPEPDGWKNPEFDDSSWDFGTQHSAEAVRPKDGYDDIQWDSQAAFIWGDDLESDNTLLCRVTMP